jgi:putative transposase
MGLHHVNFHTVRNIPVFENDEYDAMMRTTIKVVIRERQILCLVWELMPTHLHAIVADFDDFPRGMILQHLKGDTSRQFFRTYPDLREDLLGGHLWSKGYWATRIISHRQFQATLDYIRTNRTRADLLPPVPLQQYSAQ